MRIPAWPAFLFLIAATRPSRQELVQLSPIPSVTAECGQQVVLRCDVSSLRRGLSIKHMEWSKNKTHLCSVNAEGKVTHSTEGQSGFTCEYEPERLTLIFGVRPVDEAEYRCKLRSNMGTAHKYARVQLKECCGDVKVHETSDSYGCVFHGVFPGGDVHWFQGADNITDSFQVYTYTNKAMDPQGWWTISGYLKMKEPHRDYNCSLMSSRSGTYIASALVQFPRTSEKTMPRSGSSGLMRTLCFISIIFPVIMK